MRLKDIKVGTAYALDKGVEGYESRVVVLEAGVHRQVWNGWRYETSTRADGVRVVHDNEREQVVPCTKILRTWAEHESILEARKQRQQEVEDRESVIRAQVEELRNLLGDRSYNVNTHFSRDHRLTGAEVDARLLPRLIELVRKGLAAE